MRKHVLTGAVALFLLLVWGGLAPESAIAEDGAHKERAPKPAKQGMDEKRRAGVLRGLANGVEALVALGRKEEAAHLREIYESVKRGGPAKAKRKAKPHGGHAERQIAEGYVELMGLAVRTLVKAGKHDRAEVVEHGKHALELRLKGRRDDEAMKVYKTAPARGEQARALFVAAELLADHGDKKHAGLLAEIARSWLKKSKASAKREHGSKERGFKEHADKKRSSWQGEGDEALAQRIRILKMALPALREGEREKATAILQRGIDAGRVMLAKREDDEAREMLERTPSLGELAEVLHLASDLWMKFKDKEKAHKIAALAKFYAKRSKAGRAEREVHEREDHEEREADKRGQAMRELHQQMREVHEMLEDMQRRLKKLSK